MMLFNVTKAFIALAVVSAAAAAPYAAKREPNAVTCNFVFLPDTIIAPATDLVIEFNFVIGRSLSISTGGIVDQLNNTVTANNDGTYSVLSTVAAEGETAAETAALIDGWVGVTELGHAANWLVESVDCD